MLCCNLTHRSAQLLIFISLICYICISRQQVLPSPIHAGCSVGPSGLTDSLSSLTSQQLAEGRLASSNASSWDFGVPEGSLKAASGRGVTLACIIGNNVSVSRPTGSIAFLQPRALDLSNATGLNMEHVSLSTSCDSVLEYQTYFCSSYGVAGSITLWQGAIHFAAWQDSFTTLRNVTLTCLPTEAPPQPPCWLTAVQDVKQLLDAFILYVDVVATNVTVVVAADISVSKSSWPDKAVSVTNTMQLVGSSLLHRPVLDFQLLLTLWDLLPNVTVSLINITCANLAPTYISPVFPASLFAMLTHRLWPFHRLERQLNIVNSTLVVPTDEFLYMKYWLKFLLSPVPEDRLNVAWMNMTDLRVSAVNDSGVYYESAVAYTVTYSNVRLTDSLGSAYPLLPIHTGLQNLMSENVPLSAVRQIVNMSDFLVALSPSTLQPDSNGRRWLLLIANFSLADGNNSSHLSPRASTIAATDSGITTAIQLSGKMIIGVGDSVDTVRLDFGRRLDALVLAAGSVLSLRALVLGDMPTRLAAYDPQAPLDFLVSPFWGVSLKNSSSELVLENCTILVSAAELQLLQQSLLLPADATQVAAAVIFDGALKAAVRAFFTRFSDTSYSRSHLQLASGETVRYSFKRITFRTPIEADGEVNAAGVVLPTEDGVDEGFPRWKIGLIIGCVVGGIVVAGVLLVVFHRRHVRAAADGASRRQGAYETYLRSGDAELRGGAPSGPGNNGGGGGILDLVHPSQELTNSSQVLRPDARRSDFEVARLKATGSGTTSASASGGIGPGVGGRSTSTTGVTSHDVSSVAVLPSGMGGSSASGGVLGGGSGGVQGSARVSGASGGVPQPLQLSTIVGALNASSVSAHAGNGATQVSDSFERPPSDTVLGQHGPVGRPAQRLASVMGSSSVPSSSVANQSQSVLATGGAAALDQMHLMIQALGRDFNDRQLEVHSLLGRGAHGTVYKGIWRGLPVAVKSMVFSNDSSARQQSRVLMEAAISANLAHPNIVTTYSYELREVEHELASLSLELARQGGGWRLLIIQEYCDAGPLRRLVDCGFFLTPPKPSGVRTKLKLQHSMGFIMRRDSPSGEGSTGSVTRAEAAAAAAGMTSCSRGSSGSGSTNGNEGPSFTPRLGAGAGAQVQAGMPGPSHQSVQQQQRPVLDAVPSDVPGRPTTSLQAAQRYVEAALMIARGLQHIHDKNIVHGDLNPNNVLLIRAPGTQLGFCLKVADFGLSVRMAEGESHMSNLFQGSPYYCAPEVVLSGKVGKSADIYSLGIMLWELQNGTRPLWRSGVRLRSYPSLNTAELDFGSETPPRFVRLARDCFHGSKDTRPRIAMVVETLVGIKAELDAL